MMSRFSPEGRYYFQDIVGMLWAVFAGTRIEHMVKGAPLFLLTVTLMNIAGVADNMMSSECADKCTMRAPNIVLPSFHFS